MYRWPYKMSTNMQKFTCYLAYYYTIYYTHKSLPSSYNPPLVLHSVPRVGLESPGHHFSLRNPLLPLTHHHPRAI